MPIDEATQRRSWRDGINHLDLPGEIAGVTTLILFIFAWNQSYDVGWQQPCVYVYLILGVLSGIAFLLIKLYWSSAPFLPVAAFHVDVALVFGCTAAGWAVFGIWVNHRCRLQGFELILRHRFSMLPTPLLSLKASVHFYWRHGIARSLPPDQWQH